MTYIQGNASVLASHDQSEVTQVSITGRLVSKSREKTYDYAVPGQTLCDSCRQFNPPAVMGCSVLTRHPILHQNVETLRLRNRAGCDFCRRVFSSKSAAAARILRRRRLSSQLNEPFLVQHRRGFSFVNHLRTGYIEYKGSSNVVSI